MLTIFTIPKAFEGHIEVIQRNAIESWLELRPGCEVILCGDDPGVAQVASEYHVTHFPDVICNERGTPLLNSAFEFAQRSAHFPLVCYVNADIILLSDLLASIKRVTLPRFLIAGQRWDLDVTAPLSFADRNWEQNLRKLALSQGSLHPPAGSDYFVFPKQAMGELPDFAVGRPGWDNWFIFLARSLDIPVIDTTKVNMVIHQNHGYDHVARIETGVKWEGPEAEDNLELLGGHHRYFTLVDATHVLTPGGLAPAVSVRHLRRRILRLWQRRARRSQGLG